MGFLDLFRRSKTIDQIAKELDEGISRKTGGQVVNHETALGVSTVLACVDVLATSCAMPPLHVMRDLGGDQKEKAKDSTAYRLFYRRPNQLQTSFEFRWTLTAHAALTGNGYALPVYVDGQLKELLPLLPSMVTTPRTKRYEQIYEVHDDYGLIGRFAHDQIFHLRNNSWDSVRGMDVVSKARSAIGLAMAAEESQISLHANGGRPGGILTTDAELTPEAIERTRSQWAKATSGNNSFKTALLDKGLSYQQMAMTGVDAQTLESRKMQIEEISRSFGVFPQMIGHSDKTATFASAEAFFSAHTRLTQSKWQQNWIQKGDEFLLDGEGPLFLEFDNSEMLAATLKDFAEFAKGALGAGGTGAYMSKNEVRALRGLPPKPGLDDVPEDVKNVKGLPNAT